MMNTFETSKVVETGPVFVAASASKKLNPIDISIALQRHRKGDWGLVCDEVREANDFALPVGDKLLSAYDDRDQVRFWVITEPDSSYTTVRLSSK
tara:strand:+ start:454 stop:738 length:285 start_codon:yes stop_codon:yes gene_type:complete